MNSAFQQKSTTEEIRTRFDQDVERFSQLETGQQSTIDAPISLELITEAAQYTTPHAQSILDIGCGAGNYTLKMLSKVSNLNCTLVDLSMPMLERAQERVAAVTSGNIEIVQADIREAEFADEQFDIILAGAVLHHLREDAEWEAVFQKLYRLLKPGGSIWISDLVTHESPAVHQMLWHKYGEYLEGLGGPEYREKVFAYIEKEDTPRSVNYQLGLLKQVGFRQVEVLHKNLCFAAFGAMK